MTRSFYAAILLGGASLALGACGGSAEEETATDAPDTVPGLAIENARMMLPAVAGNPAAIYFDLVNSGDTYQTIRRVDVMGAESTMMHATNDDGSMSELSPQSVVEGETMTLEPGGNHLMVMGVSDELQAGGTTEMTLTVLGGDKMSVDVPIQAAGDDR